jgi:prepilin-type N-terminal cleavage/methylation domain-containing protein
MKSIKKAFTLMEVVVALGIVAVILVSILGMVSIGLQSSRESKDETNIAMMVQTVISQLRSSGYTNISNTLPAGTTDYVCYYFDSSGAPICNTTGVMTGSTNSLIVPGGVTGKPIYTCVVMNKTPAAAASFVMPLKYAYIRLDFAWPYSASHQRHKYVYTSLAQYN